MNFTRPLLAAVFLGEIAYQFVYDLRSWIWSLVLVAGAVILALIVHFLLARVAQRLARRRIFWELLIQRERKPARLIFPTLAILATLHWLPVSPPAKSDLTHFVGLVLIALLAWVALALIDVVQDFVFLDNAIEIKDNLAVRRVRTQVQVLRNIFVVGVVLVAVAVMLMTFPTIRHLGESLFASAGVAAVVAGLAARTTLTNLLAGVQIALTQPIRVDDVVIVEGEWGWIEEITTTYVIVRVWDLRRLVVPLSYFIEKPFQNWTRKSADLLGTVFLYTDYTIPVESIRQELLRILQSSGIWDGKTWGLQVTNASEHTVELRALMSAIGSSEAWDLRCYVREKLIEFLQQHYPESLPKSRAELVGLRSTATLRKRADEIDHAA